MSPTCYRGCWHVVSRGLFAGYRLASSPAKGVYDPKAFVPHAASLRQAVAHCARFPTAASRRSWGRLSVPMWLVVLSDQLPIIALVGRYPTNQLIGRGPLRERPKAFLSSLRCWGYAVLAPLSGSYPPLPGRSPTCYSPVRHSPPEGGPCDLHVLGTPPAFVLSQDQTRRHNLPSPSRGKGQRNAPRSLPFLPLSSC